MFVPGSPLEPERCPPEGSVPGTAGPVSAVGTGSTDGAVVAAVVGTGCGFSGNGRVSVVVVGRVRAEAAAPSELLRSPSHKPPMTSTPAATAANSGKRFAASTRAGADPYDCDRCDVGIAATNGLVAAGYGVDAVCAGFAVNAGAGAGSAACANGA
jgi:hypothetical protein